MIIPTRPSPLAGLAVALLGCLLTFSACAQNEVRSFEFAQKVSQCLSNMNLAIATEKTGHSQQAELLGAAQAAYAQSTNAGLPPASRSAAHRRSLDLKVQAIVADLGASMTNVALLNTARQALRQLGQEVDPAPGTSTPAFSTPAEQKDVDGLIRKLSLPSDQDVDPNNAAAFQAARDFFVCAPTGANRATNLQAVGGRLAAWESRTRRRIVWGEAALRQIQAASGLSLAELANELLNQLSSGDWERQLAAMARGADLLPPVFPSTSSTPVSPPPVKLADLLNN